MHKEKKPIKFHNGLRQIHFCIFLQGTQLIPLEGNWIDSWHANNHRKTRKWKHTAPCTCQINGKDMTMYDSSALNKRDNSTNIPTQTLDRFMAVPKQLAVSRQTSTPHCASLVWAMGHDLHVNMSSDEMALCHCLLGISNCSVFWLVVVLCPKSCKYARERNWYAINKLPNSGTKSELFWTYFRDAGLCKHDHAYPQAMKGYAFTHGIWCNVHPFSNSPLVLGLVALGPLWVLFTNAKISIVIACTL